MSVEDDSYVLVMDRRQLCALYAQHYTGFASDACADALASLILGRRCETSTDRLKARRMAHDEFSDLEFYTRGKRIDADDINIV